MSTTTTAAPVSRFTASAELEANLQRVLVDLTALHLLGKQAHWNVVGAGFRALHLQLDEIVEYARTQADDVAERMRALQVVPDGRPDVVAATTSLPAGKPGEVDAADVVASFTELLYAVVSTVRGVRTAVDQEDPTTAGLLDGIIISLEKQAWMLSAGARTV